MPPCEPDLTAAACPCPLLVTLREGTVLWRLHSGEYAPTAFNPTVRPPPGTGGLVVGGRFDATPGDPFAYLYAGGDTVAAVAETLLRDRPASPRPYRIPRARLRNLELSRLRVGGPPSLVKLHGNGLPAVGQSDNWLTSCGAAEYPRTRRWAAAIRSWAPGASGLVWRPRHDDDRLAYVFFEDRCPPGTLTVEETLAVDRPGRGLSLVRQAAMKHNAVLAAPT
jgi:hypothetical protein